MEMNFSQKIPQNFYCKKCDYTTCNKKDYDKHLLTRKHKKNENGHFGKKMEIKKSPDHKCKCNKLFVTYSGLWKHKNKCNLNLKEPNIDEKDDDFKILTNMVLEVVKQNQELITQNTETQKQNKELTNKLFEICKNGTNNITNNNSHNKTFNLNVFLNETCKDAMNIMDFIDSIKLQLCDLQKVGEIGYVEGISNIITSNLKALDINKRPVHCTDKKREVLYIKDENKWEKEDEERLKLRKAIKRIVTKNQRLLPEFKQAHPDCIKSSSPFSDQYNKMIVESMGGSGDNDIEKEDKIIRNISKNVIIGK